MRSICAAVLSAVAPIAVSAFIDSSPFFLASSSELLLSTPNLISSVALQDDIVPQLQKCLSTSYLIITQPGVTQADYRHHSTPTLERLITGKDKTIRSSVSVDDVLGSVSTETMTAAVEDACAAEHVRVDASTGRLALPPNEKPRVISIDFPPLPLGTDRSSVLAEHDSFLSSMLSLLPSTDITIIYTTTSANREVQKAQSDVPQYNMDSTFQSTLHEELKRDMVLDTRAASTNVTLPAGPLFKRYSFLSAGMFMGLLAGLFFFLILYVAIAGVSSLQITYAAFDKDIGPAAQKNKAQ